MKKVKFFFGILPTGISLTNRIPKKDEMEEQITKFINQSNIEILDIQYKCVEILLSVMVYYKEN